MPPLDVDELAHTAGRAKRSAVGLYGFLHGGLIVEAGRLPHDAVSPLVAAVAVSPVGALGGLAVCMLWIHFFADEIV